MQEKCYQQLKTLIADTIFQVHDAHTYLLPGDQDLEVSSPQTWRDNMLDANKNLCLTKA